MTTRKISVLVVDDSALMREMICDCLAATDDLVVVGTANDGKEGLEKFKELEPDVVTLDIQMPDMDGLQALDAILESNPKPVIMVSALAQRSADITLEALDRGAADYVAKPESATAVSAVLGESLPGKIRAMAGADVRRLMRIRNARKQRSTSRSDAARSGSELTASDLSKYADHCIAIGISTGGPPALTQLFSELKPPLPPIVVVQHMPATFTGQFAQRLDSLCELSVKEAATGDMLRPNHVFIARAVSTSICVVEEVMSKRL